MLQTGGEGGQTSVFTRGTNSNHTKILLDGIDISDPSTPNDTFDLGKLAPPISRGWKCCAGRARGFTAPTPLAA